MGFEPHELRSLTSGARLLSPKPFALKTQRITKSSTAHRRGLCPPSQRRYIALFCVYAPQNSKLCDGGGLCLHFAFFTFHKNLGDFGVISNSE